MASILPEKKKQTLGFKGLIEPGEQSHWAFYMLLYVACICVLFFSFLGVFLSKGDYPISLGSGFVLAALLYLFSYIAESGKVEGKNINISIGLIGLIGISFLGSYLGNHYFHHALNKEQKKNNLVDNKILDLHNSESLISFYQKRHKQLNQENGNFKSKCDYSILDSIEVKSKVWKTEIENLKNRLQDPFCLLTNRDDILNTNQSNINYSYYQDAMKTEIKNHNDAWVTNARCQVDIPVQNEGNGYITPINLKPPTLFGTFKEMNFILFLIFGSSILIFALMPFFAAKGAETILKSR